MVLNKRKNKYLFFWSLFNRVNLNEKKRLGLNCKKKSWKRFLFSAELWKKRSFSPTVQNIMLAPTFKISVNKSFWLKVYSFV